MTSSLQPGAALDRLVAEKVMGWTMRPAPVGVAQDHYQCWFEGERIVATVHTWEPSTEISNAWEVLEHLKRNSSDLSIELSSGSEFPDEWEVSVKWFDAEQGYGPFYFCAPTAPEAICLAAMKAAGL